MLRAFIDDSRLMTGVDIPLEGVGVTLHQPRLKEIAMLGEKDYFLTLQIFSMNKIQLNIANKEVTNWLIFQHAVQQKMDGVLDTTNLFNNFLRLFVPHIAVGPNSLIIQDESGIKHIEPDDFDKFQYIVSTVGGISLLKPKEEEYKPKNKRAAEIAEKMKKANKKLAERRAAETGAQDESFLKQYIRVLCTVTANSIEDVCNMTILQANEIMQTYLAKEAYDLKVKSRLAGAKDDSPLTHWMIKTSTNDNIGTI